MRGYRGIDDVVSVLAHPYNFRGKFKIKVYSQKIEIRERNKKPYKEKLMVEICEEMMRTMKDKLENNFSRFFIIGRHNFE